MTEQEERAIFWWCVIAILLCFWVLIGMLVDTAFARTVIRPIRIPAPRASSPTLSFLSRRFPLLETRFVLSCGIDRRILTNRILCWFTTNRAVQNPAG